jgi:general secretion pathway protein F
LIALSDEIAALARAGIPLEVGLGGMTASGSREIRELAELLADDLKRGTPLPAALERQGRRLPPLYAAVVAAGLRSGRLPDVLERLTRFARLLRETRRQLGLALIYPGLIVALSYFLFLFVLRHVGAELLTMARPSGLRPSPVTAAILALNRTMEYWMWIPPAVALLLAGWLWIAQRRLVPRTAFGRFTLGCVPWMRGTIRNFHLATFADLLGLLVEHGVPLSDALVLAAEATGERRFVDAARSLSGEIEQGRALSEAIGARRVFPPFMRWMIATADRQGSLAAALRQLAEMYRRRALASAEWFRIVAPVVLVLVVGGSAVLLYALGLFYPLTQFLSDLTRE